MYRLVIFSVYAFTALTAAQLQPTVDGQCGGTSGETCLDNTIGVGSCCGANGFCGSSADYCGTGCDPRYGTCSQTMASAAPAGGANAAAIGGSGSGFQSVYSLGGGQISMSMAPQASQPSSMMIAAPASMSNSMPPSMMSMPAMPPAASSSAPPASMMPPSMSVMVMPIATGVHMSPPPPGPPAGGAWPSMMPSHPGRYNATVTVTDCPDKTSKPMMNNTMPTSTGSGMAGSKPMTFEGSAASQRDVRVLMMATGIALSLGLAILISA